MARLDGVQKPGLSMAGVVFSIVKRRLGRVVRPIRIHALSRKILAGYVAMERAHDVARSVPARTKKLAQIRTAARIGCPF